MKFPDFIIIGVAKCGTTPLWFNIDKHPDITMAPRRLGKTEMYFWGTKNYTNKGIDWYKDKFDGKVCGEKTPKYSQSKLAITQMKQHIPDVKLIICLRHPVERAYSNYKMNMRSGKVHTGFTYNLLVKRYGQIGKYIKTLEKNILPVFDRSQVHICITEWLKKNTVEEMNKIYDFLNLERIDIETKRVNPLDKSYIIKPASKSMEVRRAEPWYRVWDINPETVTGELRKQGLEFYKKTNERLFDFLGYDIPEWRI